MSFIGSINAETRKWLGNNGAAAFLKLMELARVGLEKMGNYILNSLD